ncbi:MAG: carbohydrate-binding protein [Clostridia bacterium]|nr:carbohydrate-binding protein [Clostridia bacterium]
MKKAVRVIIALVAAALLCACSAGPRTPSGTAKPESGTKKAVPAETSGVPVTTAEEETEPVTEAPKAPYLKLYVDSAKFIDDESTNETGGGSGNPIQYVEGCGAGYASLGDAVVFENVDFGSRGASEMIIDFSNGDKNYSTTTLEVRIDSLTEGEPVSTYEIKYTGGWDISHAKSFRAACAIPAGVHTLYIVYTNTNSGSFDTVGFVEAE